MIQGNFNALQLQGNQSGIPLRSKQKITPFVGPLPQSKITIAPKPVQQPIKVAPTTQPLQGASAQNQFQNVGLKGKEITSVGGIGSQTPLPDLIKANKKLRARHLSNHMTSEQQTELDGIVSDMEADNLSPDQVSTVIFNYLDRNVKPPEPTEQTEPGLGDKLKSRASNIWSLAGATPAEGEGKAFSTFGVPVALIGQVAGAANDVISAGYNAIVPEKVQSVISNAGLGSILQKSGTAEKAAESYSKFKQNNPKTALIAESVGNLGLLGSEVIGAGQTKNLVKQGVKKTLKTVFPKQVAKRELAETIDIVRAPITKSVKEQALREGRIAKEGILKKTVVKPTAREIETAEVLKGTVKPKASAVENISAATNKIADTGQKVESYLQKNNAIFNRNNLKSVLDKSKDASRVIFGSEKTIENTYDAVVDEFMRILDSKPKNLSGLWEARKKFDSVIKNKFPKIFSQISGDNVRANAVKDVRRSVNDYIAGRLKEGNPYKQSLKEMNLMYDAVDNIASKGVSEIGENALSRFGKAHPVIGKVGGGIGNLAKNKLIRGSLVSGGIGAYLYDKLKK